MEAMSSLAKRVAEPMATDKGLDLTVLPRTSGNGASVPQIVGSCLSGVERVYQQPVDQITRVPTPRARTH